MFVCRRTFPRTPGATGIVATGLGVSFALFLGPACAATVTLGEVHDAERRAAAEACIGAHAALPRCANRIGFGRHVPPEQARIEGVALDWIVAADGRRRAQIEVTSPGAAALRIRLQAQAGNDGVELAFASSEVAAPGVFSLEQITHASQFWSPIVEGDTAIVEIRAAPAVDPASIHLRIAEVSHLFESPVPAPRGPTKLDRAKATRATDLACRIAEEPLLADAARSVVLLAMAHGGDSWTCTGTLIANTAGTPDPLIYTANHCVETTVAAESVNSYWDYAADTCGSPAATAGRVHLASGASKVASNGGEDWAILRLREPPPSGARFASWRAEPLAAGERGWILHHAAGLPMKASRALAGDLVPDVSDDFFVYWSMMSVSAEIGHIEGGSSGSGIFTRSGDGSRLELRGGLWGKDGQGTLAYFSRLDVAFPVVRDLLTPDSGFPPGIVPVVEYWNDDLGHQFITADPGEIAELDAGTRIRGWQRTSERFLAYAPGNDVAGTSPVCRFYRRPDAGDAHFYSASETECAGTARRFADTWILETSEAFRMHLPDPVSGACPTGTRAIHRYFDTRTGAHVYTTGWDTAFLVGRRYLQEGYGPAAPDLVAMCGPAR